MNIFAERHDDYYSIILNLPPSAKFIIYILDQRGKLNRKEIEKITLLPKRTIGYALKKLLKIGLVSKREPERVGRSRVDLRKKYYELSV